MIVRGKKALRAGWRGRDDCPRLALFSGSRGLGELVVPPHERVDREAHRPLGELPHREDPQLELFQLLVQALGHPNRPVT